MNSGTGIWIKRFFLGLVFCVFANEWMIWWLKLLFFFTELTSGYILHLILLPFHLQGKEARQERERKRGCICGATHHLPGSWVSESRSNSFLMNFASRPFPYYIDPICLSDLLNFLRLDKLKRALGWEIEAQQSQDTLWKGSFDQGGIILHQFWIHLQNTCKFHR